MDEAKRRLSLKCNRGANTVSLSTAKLLDKQGALSSKELDKQGSSAGKGELDEVTAESRFSFEIEGNVLEQKCLRTQ